MSQLVHSTVNLRLFDSQFGLKLSYPPSRRRGTAVLEGPRCSPTDIRHGKPECRELFSQGRLLFLRKLNAFLSVGSKEQKNTIIELRTTER